MSAQIFLTVPPIIDELSIEDRFFVVQSLQKLVNSSVIKYVKGQKEHGGKLTDRDCLEEAHMEIIDLSWYLFAEAERRKNNYK